MNTLKSKLTVAKLKRAIAREEHTALRCLVLKPPAKTCAQAEAFLTEYGANILEDGLNERRRYFLGVIADRDTFIAYRSRKACLAAAAELANREVYAIHREMNALAASVQPSDLE